MAQTQCKILQTKQSVGGGTFLSKRACDFVISAVNVNLQKIINIKARFIETGFFIGNLDTLKQGKCDDATISAR